MGVRYWSSGRAYVSGCGKTASKKRKTTAPEGRRPGHRRCDVASERAPRRHHDRAVVGNVRLQAGAALLARHGFVRLHEPLLVHPLAAAGLAQRIGGRGALPVRAAGEELAARGGERGGEVRTGVGGGKGG